MKTLFTITTCVHLKGKKEQIEKSLKSLFENEGGELNTVYRYVLINEYSEKDETEYLNSIKVKFPKMEIIQKEEQDVGQARSINIILEMLRKDKPTYWLHWEESWETNTQFLEEAINVMNENTNIHQLQIARGWEGYIDKKNERFGTIKKEYVEKVEKSLGRIPVNHGRWRKHPWPMYSLQPGIDRVSFIVDIGDFDSKYNNNPKGKVDGSEFQFAHRWFCRGGTKAVLLPFRVSRQKNHVTTKTLLKA